MQKKPVGIIMLAVYGFIVGISNILSCVFYPSFYFSICLAIAFICGILGFGLIKMWNWVRIAAIIFSLFIICLFIFLAYGVALEFAGYKQTWVFLELIRLFPSLLFSICAIYYLTRPKVKKQFNMKVA